MDDDAGTLTKYLNGGGVDNKLRVQTGTSVNYFLADHLGSTNGLADASGAMTSSTAYDSFGNQTSSLATRYGYTGRERDDLSDLMYYRARSYDSNLGRFASEDPIGFGGGDINLYGYVRNTPLSFSDPFGLDEYSMMERLANPQPSSRPVNEALDELQMMLAILGMTPGIGEPFDIADGVVSAARGEYCDLAITVGSVVPFAGWGAGAAKIARRTKKYANSRTPYAPGQIDEVWSRAKDADGRVFDPISGEELKWDRTQPRNGQWDMGHRETMEYKDYHDRYMNGEITLEEFKQIHRDPSTYRPQSVKTNRGWRRRK